MKGIVIEKGEKYFTHLKKLWIWGVFSAFPKDISEEKVLEYALPEADGNVEIWQNPVSIQHPLAEIEIIAWDSSATVFISKKDSIVDLLREKNESAVDLEEYNASG